jgi:hypothetical protein
MDTLDHNCNGFKGCNDIFDLVCAASAYCWGQCTAPDPMCVCPVGTGDAATCPDGYWGKVANDNFGTGKPPVVECCPCTANDCQNIECCWQAECVNNSYCGQFTCGPVAGSCNGLVDFDCDFEDLPTDNPEDCDAPCCRCRPSCP